MRNAILYSRGEDVAIQRDSVGLALRAAPGQQALQHVITSIEIISRAGNGVDGDLLQALAVVPFSLRKSACGTDVGRGSLTL